MLTVADLMEMLREYPEDTPVVIDGRRLDATEVSAELSTDYYADGTPVVYITT